MPIRNIDLPARPDLMKATNGGVGLPLRKSSNWFLNSKFLPRKWQLERGSPPIFQETTIALEHAGMLEDRSLDGWNHWRAGMRLSGPRTPMCVRKSPV